MVAQSWKHQYLIWVFAARTTRTTAMWVLQPVLSFCSPSQWSDQRTPTKLWSLSTCWLPRSSFESFERTTLSLSLRSRYKNYKVNQIVVLEIINFFKRVENTMKYDGKGDVELFYSLNGEALDSRAASRGEIERLIHYCLITRTKTDGSNPIVTCSKNVQQFIRDHVFPSKDIRNTFDFEVFRRFNKD